MVWWASGVNWGWECGGLMAILLPGGGRGSWLLRTCWAFVHISSFCHVDACKVFVSIGTGGCVEGPSLNFRGEEDGAGRWVLMGINGDREENDLSLSH